MSSVWSVYATCLSDCLCVCPNASMTSLFCDHSYWKSNLNPQRPDTIFVLSIKDLGQFIDCKTPKREDHHCDSLCSWSWTLKEQTVVSFTARRWPFQLFSAHLPLMMISVTQTAAALRHIREGLTGSCQFLLYGDSRLMKWSDDQAGV